MKPIPLLLAAVALPHFALAQEPTAHGNAQHMMHTGDAADVVVPDSLTARTGHNMDHSAAASAVVTQGGQGAFAAIQEIVARLMADPETDWSRVDIEALRQHLIDMDNVTLRAAVETETVEGGARFLVTSKDPSVTASIRAMVLAHAATMDGLEGRRMQAEKIPGGAALTVTGDPVRIRALSFIGLMTIGMHHQAHHLALASGKNPHRH